MTEPTARRSSTTPYPALCCPVCKARLFVELAYVGRGYSEAREHDGYECLDCYASWDTDGQPTPFAGWTAPAAKGSSSPEESQK
jgi:hypothetical protein